jgi:hypothetical protein
MKYLELNGDKAGQDVVLGQECCLCGDGMIKGIDLFGVDVVDIL